MKKLFIAVLALSSTQSFSSEHCSQTWKADGRIYAEIADGNSDIEVFVPAHASKAALRFRNNKNAAVMCLKGSTVPAGDRYIFIANDVSKGI